MELDSAWPSNRLWPTLCPRGNQRGGEPGHEIFQVVAKKSLLGRLVTVGGQPLILVLRLVVFFLQVLEPTHVIAQHGPVALR